MTPTGRGFKEHVGYFQGQVDYYNKTVGRKGLVDGFDFWNGRGGANDSHNLFGIFDFWVGTEIESLHKSRTGSSYHFDMWLWLAL